MVATVRVCGGVELLIHEGEAREAAYRRGAESEREKERELMRERERGGEQRFGSSGTEEVGVGAGSEWRTHRVALPAESAATEVSTFSS